MTVKLVVNDNAISPEYFDGNPLQKIQAALDYAIQSNVAVRFKQMYDITGLGSLVINKPDAGSSIDRTVLYLLGEGGGIYKADAGSIFTAPANVTSIGDINVRGMRFQSIAGRGTIVWDADKIIRVSSTDGNYLNVDTIASAPTKYFQSMRFVDEHYTGGNGWLFEFRESFDVTIKDNLIESRQNGIRNTVGLAQLQNRALRIKDNLMENLSGIAIQLGSCFGASIESNYFEANAGSHIDLLTLSQWYQYGMRIVGNMFAMTSAQITAGTPAVNWGSIYAGANAGGAVSQGNVCNGTLHNVKSDEVGVIKASGDYAATAFCTGKPAQYVQLS